MKKKVVIFFCLCTIIVLESYAIIKNNKTDSLPFSINYNVSLQATKSETFDKYYYSVFQGKDDIVHLKCYPNITKEKANKIIEDRKFILTLTYTDQVSPYPGILSSVVGCPENVKPKPIEDTILTKIEYRLLATSNLIFGNCNVSDNYYACFYTLFYCPNTNDLFELKIFTPIQHPSFDYINAQFNINCAQ